MDVTNYIKFDAYLGRNTNPLFVIFQMNYKCNIPNQLKTEDKVQTGPKF